MNQVIVKNAEITKTWEATTPRGPVMNMIFRDTTGSHAVYFQTAFWGQEAVIAKQSLKKGDLICITGNMWIKSQQTQAGKESFVAILEKPRDVHKLSATYLDLSDNGSIQSQKPYAEASAEDITHDEVSFQEQFT